MNTPLPTDFESFLRSLSSESLSVNRDELFYQAGYAAGSKTKGARLFWPSAVAALLVVCIGLGVAMQRQAVALHAAIAADEQRRDAHPSVIVNDDSTKPKSAANPQKTALSKVEQPNLEQNTRYVFDKRQLRSWEELATASVRQHGRLSARGWTESIDDYHEPTDSPADQSAPRLRANTYLELRQQHLEG